MVGWMEDVEAMDIISYGKGDLISRVGAGKLVMLKDVKSL